jgi:hypothetical protein
MNAARHARVIAAVLLVLVAGTGFAAGVFTERMLHARTDEVGQTAAAAPEGVRILLRGRDPLPADGVRRFGLLLPERLAEELDLTPEQQAEIERILREDQAAIRDITGRFEPALVTVIERSRQRIHDVLTDEQIARWHAMPVLRLRRTTPDSTR